jgi:hypothetical protein
MKTLEIVRANFGSRKEKLDELRAIDEAAVGRAYTDDETSKVTELRTGLEAIDTRLSTLLSRRCVRRRSATPPTASSALSSTVTTATSYDTRSIGQRFVDTDGVRNG